MEALGFACPFKLFVRKGVFRRRKVYLVLRTMKCLAELKVEPDYKVLSGAPGGI